MCVYICVCVSVCMCVYVYYVCVSESNKRFTFQASITIKTSLFIEPRRQSDWNEFLMFDYYLLKNSLIKILFY